MKRKAIAIILLSSFLFASCSKQVEETTTIEETSATTTEATTEETTTATPTPRPPTATPTPRPSPTPMPERDGTFWFANPFTNPAQMDMEELNCNIDEERLTWFYDLFFTGWFYSWEDIEQEPLIGYSSLNYNLALGDGMNFRPAWINSTYNDPRDCNPYYSCFYLQEDGFDIQADIDEFTEFAENYEYPEDLIDCGGDAICTPMSVIEAQVQEFTGYSNSELSHPFGTCTYNGQTYVVDGPTREGGYGAPAVISGYEYEDGTVILFFAYSGNVPGSVCTMVPNGDGTYRILNNHNPGCIFMEGSFRDEMSSEELLELITAEVYEVDMWIPDGVDVQYHYDECIRFSVYLSRNAYLAAYGVIFEDPLLQAWFECYSWYEPIIPESEFDYSVMSDVELANVQACDDLLAEYS